ncbi:hypothetical protein M9H77_35677 [Catharanthus roseus]|uniref:Uncharacterized protein n=1 Tax=Catharanthus roseus TaxID=4058 RepID=A0ACB9ZPP2_CATRO|nr:hypothetical protein M9H77_35677 [Catharanthus roseus]
MLVIFREMVYLPSTPTPLPAGFYYDIGALESSTQPPPVPFRSRPPHPSHLSHTPVPYDVYRSAYVHSQPPPAVYDPYLAAPIVRPDIPYRSSAQEPLTEFSGPPFIGRRHSTDLGAEADSGLGEEPDRVRSVHIGLEGYERVDDEDDGDGDNDDHDDGEDAGDKEQPVSLAPVAYASGSDGRPYHRKGKGLTGSFMSIMSKISGSRNKRPNKARDVPAPTQWKRLKASDWEQTGPAEGGPADPELIPSYGGMWLDRYGVDRIVTVDLHLLRDQLVVVIQSNLGLAFIVGGINGQELFDVATSRRSTISSIDRATCYIQYLLGSSLVTDKSVNIVPSRLWPLVKDVRLAKKQYIPTHPIRSQEARRSSNNRMYVVRNLFVEALWLEALSHLLTEIWTSVPAIPSNACTDVNIPRGFHVPVDPPMPNRALLDLISHEARREDTGKVEKFDRIADLLSRHYRGT